MIICVCNNISEKKIEEILNTKIEKNERIYSIKDLNKEIPICNNCYACFNDVKKIIEKKNQLLEADIFDVRNKIYAIEKICTIRYIFFGFWVKIPER